MGPTHSHAAVRALVRPVAVAVHVHLTSAVWTPVAARNHATIRIRGVLRSFQPTDEINSEAGNCTLPSPLFGPREHAIGSVQAPARWTHRLLGRRSR